jgi:hypothetical protein
MHQTNGASCIAKHQAVGKVMSCSARLADDLLLAGKHYHNFACFTCFACCVFQYRYILYYHNTASRSISTASQHALHCTSVKNMNMMQHTSRKHAENMHVHVFENIFRLPFHATWQTSDNTQVNNSCW